MLGKRLVGKPSDIESRPVQRTAVISGPSNPRHPHSEASTAGVVLQEAAAPHSASQTEVGSGTITPVPVRREREIRFPDEGDNLDANGRTESV